MSRELGAMRCLVTISVVSLPCLAACAGPKESSGVKHPGEPRASWAARESPPPPREKLAPPPASLALGRFWPTRICARDPAVFVIENSCACDSRMTCTVTPRGNTLDLHVEMTQEICKDCGTFMAICTVPPQARARPRTTRTVRLTLDGKPLLSTFELPHGAPTKARCYE